MHREHKAVGTVREIWRYPVKSMAGQQVESTKVGWNGLAGDRRYALNRVGHQSGLPFLSAREMPDMILYHPAFRDPGNLDHSGIDVVTPAGVTYDLYASELRAELEVKHGGKLDVISLWRGTYDAMPVSLITTHSIRSISSAIATELGTARFRPNIVIESAEDRPYPEEKWVGELLVFGDDVEAARVRANRKDLRCTVVNVDPQTGERNTAVLSEIVKNRKNFLGLYGSTERPGKIKVGDVVFVAVDR